MFCLYRSADVFLSTDRLKIIIFPFPKLNNDFRIGKHIAYTEINCVPVAMMNYHIGKNFAQMQL